MAAELPFQGELMTCLLCQKEQRSDPAHNSQWRSVLFNGRTYYACPDHFPDDTAGGYEFKEAYKAFILAALRHAERTGVDEERGDAP